MRRVQGGERAGEKRESGAGRGCLQIDDPGIIAWLFKSMSDAPSLWTG